MDNLEGMNLALLNHHLPFEIVTEHDVESGLDRKQFKALILANAMCLSDATVMSISDFVNAGGGLLATYRTSMLNEKGEDRNEMALARILGIETMGLVVRPGGTLGGGTAALGREATNWYRVFEANPVGIGLEGRVSTFDGGMVKIGRRGEDTRIVAQALDYNYAKEAMLPSAWWPWWPGQPGFPLIVEKDRGRVIYFAGDLDGAFLRWGWPEIAQLIANAVRCVAGPPPIEVDGPSSVQAEIYESSALKDGFVCLLSNRTTNSLFPKRGSDSGYHWVTEVVPVHNVRVKVVTRADRIKEVTAITKQPVEAKVDGGFIHLTVPVLTEYEGIFVRW
jgi:hypothetical protein